MALVANSPSAITRALALAMPLAIGCNIYTEHTRVLLRDPSRVMVTMETSHGVETLVHAGRDPEVGNIPATDPPYAYRPHEGSVAQRLADGAVTVLCPGCTGRTSQSVVGADGRVDLRGTPGHTLDWGPDGLTMHFEPPELQPCRHGSRQCEGSNLALRLQTPADNVNEVRRQRTVPPGSRSNAWISVPIGIASIVMGLVLPFVPQPEHPQSVGTRVGVGLGFVAFGGLFLGEGIAQATATDSDTVVPMPSRTGASHPSTPHPAGNAAP